MTETLKKYCTSTNIRFTENELLLIDAYFEPQTFKRGKLLLTEGKICNFIAFISVGSVRHFHIKDGNEKTCEISFENQFVTDFGSFTYGTPSYINLQALEDTEVLIVKKAKLFELYKNCPHFETFGRLMAEKIALRATEIAMSLSSEKPETRYKNLLARNPDLFQRVQQKYIANFLGISPESLSRIRKRIYTEEKS
jgi:CRP-like cAMP-binding protein